MPNIGIRGVMWQEIEGRKRTTPSRMMVSIFQMEDLNNLIVRMTGEYRWEMCKRIQGARWNDVSDASLTSEYFDYIQFYKKNRDLSADAKDKVKLSMQKAKNSFKEMFIRDYCSWIIYEGAGSPRLNKVARTILFTYCPFAKEIRNKLKANPLYKDMMDRYDIKLGQKIHMNNCSRRLKISVLIFRRHSETKKLSGFIMNLQFFKCKRGNAVSSFMFNLFYNLFLCFYLILLIPVNTINAEA